MLKRQSKSLKQIGKKGQEWIDARGELKQEFQAMGITSCEIHLTGCWRNNALGFAHTRKRRDVVDLKRVVLACNPCHDKVEHDCPKWTGTNMETFLEGIIRGREAMLR